MTPLQCRVENNIYLKIIIGMKSSMNTSFNGNGSLNSSSESSYLCSHLLRQPTLHVAQLILSTQMLACLSLESKEVKALHFLLILYRKVRSKERPQSNKCHAPIWPERLLFNQIRR